MESEHSKQIIMKTPNQPRDMPEVVEDTILNVNRIIYRVGIVTELAGVSVLAFSPYTDAQPLYGLAGGLAFYFSGKYLKSNARKSARKMGRSIDDSF